MREDRHPTQKEQRAAGVEFRELSALLTLDQVRGFGPAAFRATFEAGIKPEVLLEDPGSLPLGGKRGDTLRKQVAELSLGERKLAEERAARQISRAAELSVRILTYKSRDYPPNLFFSNNPVPMLFARGDLQVLRQKNTVACVGSRKIRPVYLRRLQAFSELAAKAGWLVASGFANGADTAAHKAAITAKGTTVLVMPSGLDIPFPPENRGLWKDWLDHARVAMISEFPLGTKASGLTLRKRNKTIVGVSKFVLVAQSSQKGGTMNSYRFAVEQRKPVLTFPPDDQEDTSGNRMILERMSTQTDILDQDANLLDQAEHWLTLSSST
jgi:DNA processing protein